LEALSTTGADLGIAGTGLIGSSIVNVAPPPGELEALMLPFDC